MAKKFKCNVCGKTFEAETMPEKCPICGAPASEIKEVKTGLNTNSNAYTIVYSAVMVIIVAFLLAFVSSALKPTQDANVENDTKGQILTAMGFSKESVDVKAEFDKVQDFVLDESQAVMTPYEGKFESTYGTAIKEGRLHVFVGKNKDGEEVYVLPVVLFWGLSLEWKSPDKSFIRMSSLIVGIRKAPAITDRCHASLCAVNLG